MSKDMRMFPVPPSTRDNISFALHKVPADLRFELRMAFREVYAAGYDDGHRDGYHEAKDDAYAEREQAERETETTP